MYALRATVRFAFRSFRLTVSRGTWKGRLLNAVRRALVKLPLVLAFTALSPSTVHSHEGHKHEAGGGSAVALPAPIATSLRIPDVVLRDADDEPVSVHRALSDGNVVVLSFVYTTCTTICSTIGFQMAELERRLARRTDLSCKLISVSIDPVTDTPARLKAWSARFHPGPGWTFLTGDKPDVDALLKAFKIFTPDIKDHSPIVLIGNGQTGQWTRTSAFADPDTLIALIGQASTRREN